MSMHTNITTRSSVLSFCLVIFLGASAARAGQPGCLGDCSGDGAVTIDELVRGVNIALDSATVDQCPAFDLNANGQVTVDELVGAINNALNGCLGTPTPTPTPVGGTRTPTVLTGLIEVESFIVASGDLALVSGDVTIRTTGAVRIDGELRAGDASSQDIVIDAGGDVLIGGPVVAGNGASRPAPARRGAAQGVAAPNDAGSIVIRSAGDIVLDAGARLAAGDGTDGGNGGDVVLHAPDGTITIADGSDVIHIGNGGDGNAVSENAQSPLGEENLDNSGGRSGALLLSATAVSGISAQAVTLAADFSPAGDDLVFVAGQPAFTTVAAPLVSGGRGGNAGAFDFGEGLPAGAMSVVRAALRLLQGGQGGLPLDPIVRRGADGGDGFVFGGAGADVSVTGGPSVTAVGGNGGGCLRIFDRIFCTPGDGGDAEAQGAPGMDGPGPGDPGGDGAAPAPPPSAATAPTTAPIPPAPPSSATAAMPAPSAGRAVSAATTAPSTCPPFRKAGPAGSSSAGRAEAAVPRPRSEATRSLSSPTSGADCRSPAAAGAATAATARTWAAPAASAARPNSCARRTCSRWGRQRSPAPTA
jgi:hypothetical protein